jgi:hypothetical protein
MDAAGEAAGEGADPSECHRADEAAEIADRPNPGDAGRSGGTVSRREGIDRKGTAAWSPRSASEARSWRSGNFTRNTTREPSGGFVRNCSLPSITVSWVETTRIAETEPAQLRMSKGVLPVTAAIGTSRTTLSAIRSVR